MPRLKLTSLPVALVLVALAEEVDLGDDDAASASLTLRRADVGEQPAPAGLDLDLAADLARHGDAGIGIAGELAQPLAARSRPARRRREISTTLPIGSWLGDAGAAARPCAARSGAG